MSKVWNDFVKYKDPGGYEKALCNHCKKSLGGDNNSGTSHLAAHLTRCTTKIYKDKGQKTIATMKNLNSIRKVESFKFDQHWSMMDLARMIIKNNYSFNMVDHEFFKYIFLGLNLDFKIPTRNTVRYAIIKLHEEMKHKVYEMVDGLCSRLTLTTDIWTSDSHNFAYAY